MQVRHLLATLIQSNNATYTNLSLILKNHFQTFKTNIANRNSRLVHTNVVYHKEKDRQYRVSTAVRRDQGTQGEETVDIDFHHKQRLSMFPDLNTPNLMFNGLRYDELPICHVKATKNNTLMTVTDRLGRIKLRYSCGCEGFKNTRKGTNIAAQATGITLGKKTIAKGITDVRVKVRGLGPGRMTSVRGLQMAGVNIVSLTDDTPVPLGKFPRPRKQKKL